MRVIYLIRDWGKPEKDWINYVDSPLKLETYEIGSR